MLEQLAGGSAGHLARPQAAAASLGNGTCPRNWQYLYFLHIQVRCASWCCASGQKSGTRSYVVKGGGKRWRGGAHNGGGKHYSACW